MSTENKDFRVKNGLSVAGGGTFGAPVTVPTPTDASHAATKDYVDNISLIPGPEGPAGSYIASDTPPANPENNTAWFDTTTGATFMYYDGFWIETTGALGPTGPAGADGTDGSSGVVSVTGNIINTGTASAAILGIADENYAKLISGAVEQTFLGPNIFSSPYGDNQTPIAVEAQPDQTDPLQTWHLYGKNYITTQIKSDGSITSDVRSDNTSGEHSLAYSNSSNTKYSALRVSGSPWATLSSGDDYAGYGELQVQPTSIAFRQASDDWSVSKSLEMSKTEIIAYRPTKIYAPSDTVGLLVHGANGQTENLQNWADDSDTILASVSPNGDFTAASIAKTGGTSEQFLKADGSVDSETYLVSNAPTITNPTINASFSMEEFMTEYLVSAYQSTNGNQITISFSSWGTPFVADSFAAGDLVRIVLQSGTEVLDEPVTVVSFTLLNSQLVVTTDNPTVLSQLSTLDVFGANAYRTRNISVTLSPEDFVQLKSLSSTPAIPTSGDVLSVGKHFIPTNESAYSLSLPPAPRLGDEVQIFDAANYGTTNPVTILRNGNKINGLSDNAILDSNGFAATFIYTGSTYGWRMG